MVLNGRCKIISRQALYNFRLAQKNLPEWLNLQRNPVFEARRVQNKNFAKLARLVGYRHSLIWTAPENVQPKFAQEGDCIVLPALASLKKTLEQSGNII